MDAAGRHDPLKRVDPAVMLDDDDASRGRGDHYGVAGYERLTDQVGVDRCELVQLLVGHEEGARTGAEAAIGDDDQEAGQAGSAVLQEGGGDLVGIVVVDREAPPSVRRQAGYLIWCEAGRAWDYAAQHGGGQGPVRVTSHDPDLPRLPDRFVPSTLDWRLVASTSLIAWATWADGLNPVPRMFRDGDKRWLPVAHACTYTKPRRPALCLVTRGFG